MDEIIESDEICDGASTRDGSFLDYIVAILWAASRFFAQKNTACEYNSIDKNFLFFRISFSVLLEFFILLDRIFNHVP